MPALLVCTGSNGYLSTTGRRYVSDNRCSSCLQNRYGINLKFCRGRTDSGVAHSYYILGSGSCTLDRTYTGYKGTRRKGGSYDQLHVSRYKQANCCMYDNRDMWKTIVQLPALCDVFQACLVSTRYLQIQGEGYGSDKRQNN